MFFGLNFLGTTFFRTNEAKNSWCQIFIHKKKSLEIGVWLWHWPNLLLSCCYFCNLVFSLCCYCPLVIVAILYYSCVVIVPGLCFQCVVIVAVLCFHCFVIVAVLYFRCVVIVAALCFHCFVFLAVFFIVSLFSMSCVFSVFSVRCYCLVVTFAILWFHCAVIVVVLCFLFLLSCVFIMLLFLLSFVVIVLSIVYFQNGRTGILLAGEFRQTCRLVTSTNHQYLCLDGKNEKSKTNLFLKGLKFWKIKYNVPSLFLFLAFSLYIYIWTILLLPHVHDWLESPVSRISVP